MNVVANETSGHEVMKAAGFTHGGFYNHFLLLSELVGAIILARAVAQANRSLSDEILEAVSMGLQTHMK